MRSSRRFVPFLLAACAAVAVSCGERAEPPSGPSSGVLDPALDGIADPAVIALIGDLFPPDLRIPALVQYGQIRAHAARSEMDAAVGEAFDFLAWTLGHLAAGHLVPPEPITPAEGVVLLFELIFAELGVEGPPLTAANLEGDVAVGLLGPAGGGVTVPSLHAAISFDPGMLSGPTWVIVAGLPDPQDPGGCPFGFTVDTECYPLFYDFTIHPESNLVGIPRIGMCVVEFGPLAPSETVEMRLRIASENEAVPGTIVFWPLTTAPSSVDCSDLETPPIVGWQGELFDALGPLAGVFRVTPAFANPGRLGGSITAFSPFAPADPEGGEEEPPPPEEDIGVIEGQVLNSFGQP
ncbi:MAG TPA: hypothetical protein VM778_14275, partial [Gemmatimonadota bacterium]|nr:hypothetical protein [Gemmatimonadota bacterium]